MFTTTGAWGLWGDGAWQSRKDFIKNSCCHNDTTAKEPHRPNTAITIMKLYECCIVEAYYDFKKEACTFGFAPITYQGHYTQPMRAK